MVLPVHDTNPVRRTPVVTYALIAINLVVFALEPIHHFSFGGHDFATPSLCQQLRFFDQYAAIPHELISGDVQPHRYVDQFGNTVCRSDFPHKQPALSVFYSMFLHGSWLHVLGNMLFLYVFGNNVEDRLGHVGYIVFYLVAGYVAAYGFALVFRNSQTALIGASGAIAGVLGAYLVFWPRARIWSLVTFLLFIPLRLPAWLVLGSWFLLQWWYSVGGLTTQGPSAQQSGVAYLAHVIGFAFGVLVGLLLRDVGGSRRRARGYPPPEWQSWRRPYR